MTATDLLDRAHSLGLRLGPREGGGLGVQPASRLPPDLAADLRAHKHEVIALLANLASSGVAAPQQEQPSRGWHFLPPNDLPLVALKSTPTPARCQLVVAYVRRQCTHQQLRDWLTQRRTAYQTTIGSTWDKPLLSYAAARDAACWQLDRPEPVVWPLLEEIESCDPDLQARPARRQAPLSGPPSALYQ
jgi:hypothetical protein